MKIPSRQLLFLLLITLLTAYGFAVDDKNVRLYTMDCGTLVVTDMSSFSSTGKLDTETATLANPCFLIRHPKGDLIWDTGYGESLVERPEGDKNGAFHSIMKRRLTDQLAELDLKPGDIEFLAISHLHPDHSGNSNLFAASTFIANKAEREFMFSDEIRKIPEFYDGYSELESARTILFEEYYDVFGDGKIVVKSMPGHTPGSSVLQISLNNSGKLLLTGDLYTHSKARELNTVPSFNTDKNLTLKSRKRFEDLARTTGARVIVQHSKADFESLPVFPAYLD